MIVAIELNKTDSVKHLSVILRELAKDKGRKYNIWLR
jgi:hypothetical protein